MESRNARLTRIGEVVKAGTMDKTIVVKIVSRTNHPVYKKVVYKSNTFKVHDENNEAKIGDTVEIMETRPLSKDKYHRLVKIIARAK